MRYVGTVVRGIRTPIIKEDTNLADTVIDSLMKAKESEKFEFRDRDIVAITEAVVGISEGNYVSVDDIATDVLNKFPDKEVGLVFPILSRNRFSMILKGIARSMDKIIMMLSFPSDEVGNGIMDEDKLENSPFNQASIIKESDYYQYFGDFIHPFTGINMVDFYKNLIESENCQVEFVFSNNPKDILKYTSNVINCDIHTRYKTKEILKKQSANVYGLYEIMNKPINGSGYNPEYGLLGSNKSTEERLKLFPITGDKLVNNNLMNDDMGGTGNSGNSLSGGLTTSSYEVSKPKVKVLVSPSKHGFSTITGLFLTIVMSLFLGISLAIMIVK